MLVFALFVLGFTTHFLLDLLLGHVSGIMLLLFPVSWSEYQLGWIHADNPWVALVLLGLACARPRAPEPETAGSLSQPIAAAGRIFAPSPPNPPLNATALV